MANYPFGYTGLILNGAYANLDGLWGPYESLADAKATITGGSRGLRAVGKKFGVKVYDGSTVVDVKEYQWTGTGDNDYKELGSVGTLQYQLPNATNPTTSTELGEALEKHKVVTVEGYIASLRLDPQAGLYKIDYVDDTGTLHQIQHSTSNNVEFYDVDYGFKPLNPGNLDEILKMGGNGYYWGQSPKETYIEADSSNGVTFSRGSTTDLTISTSSENDNVYLTFNDGNHSFNVLIPSLRMNGRDLQYSTPTAGTWITAATVSELKIKEVYSNPDTAPIIFTETAAFAEGDLILQEDANNTGTYYIKVCTEVGTGTYTWTSVGSINNISLEADQVSLTSTKLSSTDVKGGLEELYDKIDGVGTGYWTGSIGISSATLYSNVSGLTEYNKQSEPIDVDVTAAGYLWIISSVKIIAETSGIEIPMLTPVKSGDFYYYRSEEVVNGTISVMIKALAKQEGTDPNDNITISGDALETITKTAGDAYVTLSLPTITSNNGGILSYQWEKQGQAISGANSQTYEVGGTNQDQELVESDSGHYRCKITNSLGGYEYTKGTILVVNASQGGGSDTSEFMGNTGVVDGAIALLNGYCLSKMYELTGDTEIYAWTGFNNNSSSSFAVFSIWDASGEQCLYQNKVVADHGKGVTFNVSANPSWKYLRVMFKADVLDKCFIYDITNDEFLYKGSSLSNVYNGFKFWRWLKTGSGSTGELIVPTSSTYTWTHASPLLLLNNTDSIIAYTGIINSNGGAAKVAFYGSGGENDYLTYYSVNANDPRTCDLTVSTLANAVYVRVFINAGSMHDCYLYDDTNKTYLWKGIDVVD